MDAEIMRVEKIIRLFLNWRIIVIQQENSIRRSRLWVVSPELLKQNLLLRSVRKRMARIYLIKNYFAKNWKM